VGARGLNSIKGTSCFLEQETIPSLLNTGWFENRFEFDLHKQNLLISQSNSYDSVTVFSNLLILWQCCLYSYTIFLLVFRKKSWACFTPLSNWFWLAIICSQCIIWLLNLLNESSSYSIHHMLNNGQWHHGLFKYQHVYIAVFALYSVVKFWLHSALLMFPAFIVQYSEL